MLAILIHFKVNRLNTGKECLPEIKQQTNKTTMGSGFYAIILIEYFAKFGHLTLGPYSFNFGPIFA